MSFVSQDLELVETYRDCLGLPTPVRALRTRAGGIVYRVQWANRRLYDWFLALGLMPAKSLKLGPLAIPDACFADFFRGCIDGDGSVQVYRDRHHAAKNRDYVYERLYVSLVSASRHFLNWVQARVGRLTGVVGVVHERHPKGRKPIWVLRYAKTDSIALIRWMYYAPDVSCLDRKRARAEKFLTCLGEVHGTRVGRPRVGWRYNAQVPRSTPE
jgi:hypothetical protein